MDGIKAPTTERSKNAESRGAAENGSPKKGPQTPPEEPSKPKISIIMGALMIATALLFDGGQFLIEVITGLSVYLLPLGIAIAWAIDGIAWLTFYMWFHSLGLGTIKKGGVAALNQTPTMLITFALGIEMIPGVNTLPAWTASIIIVILKERALRLLQIAAPLVK